MRTSEIGFVESVSQLWERDHARLWRSLLAWSGDAEVASDACAEAFAQLLRRGDAVREPAAWVWPAAFRIAGGMLQHRGTSRAIAATDDLPSTDAGAGESLALVQALAALPEADRRVVVLSLVAGWSSDEIAKAEKTSAGAVRVRLHRARRTLQQRLEVHDD